tara:strand:- start:234 stop:413 length:180 start_codon:yes stop_codon:yes gene_type:complete
MGIMKPLIWPVQRTTSLWKLLPQMLCLPDRQGASGPILSLPFCAIAADNIADNDVPDRM